MGKVYRFDDAELRILDKQPMPLAVYQYVDRHVYTLALSDGFLELFGYTDRAEAYSLSNQNALYNTHPDDVGRVGDAVHRFTVEDGRYEVIFHAKRHMGQDCHIVHGIGEHIYTDTGVRRGSPGQMDRSRQGLSVSRRLHTDAGERGPDL